MEPHVKISALLPSLNVADYIEQCIRSVMDQTLREIEILCIDAGSDDGTAEIIRRLAEEDDRIQFITVDVRSYGYQMNLGLKIAKGEYIAIVETDDYIDTDMFEQLYKKASQYSLDMVKGTLYESYAAAGGEEKEILWDYISDEYNADTVLAPDEDTRVHAWDGNIWNGIYRTDFLRSHKITFQETPGAAFQDIAFQQMVLNEASAVMYTKQHFYHYRRVREGASTFNPKCTQFIKVAYSGLLADERLKASHKRYIYSRLAWAYLNELRKVLCLCDYKIDNMDYPESAEWFEGEIKKALGEGIFSFFDVDEWNRDEVMLFFADKGAYMHYIQAQMEALYGWLDLLKEKKGGRELVIFGMGNYGYSLLLFLIKNGVWIDGIADNQKWSNNTSFYDWKVMSADDAMRYYSDAFYLIANKRYGGAIIQQLERGGIDRKQMLLFDGSDKELLKGIRRCPILARRHKKIQFSRKDGWEFHS